MPDRSYISSDPPTAVDHLLSHPFEIVISTWSIIAGLMFIAGGIFDDFDPAPSIDSLHFSLLIPLGLLFVIGGSLVHFSYWSTRCELGVCWAVERAASLILAGSWIAYGVAVLTYSPDRVVQWGNAIAFAVSFIYRWVAIGSRAKLLRRTQKSIRLSCPSKAV